MTPSEDFSDVLDLPRVGGGVPASTPVTNPDNFSDVLDLPRVESPLISAYKGIPVDNPDEAAKIVSLAQQTGEHPDFIQNNLPAAQAAVAGPTPDHLAQVEQESPRAAGWLANPKNMAVAHDDLDNLSATERVVQNIHGTANLLFNHGLATPEDVAEGAGRVAKTAGAALETGQASVRLGLLEYDRLLGLGTPDSEATAVALRSRIESLEPSRPTRGVMARGAYGALELLPFLAGGMIEGVKYGVPVAAAAAAAGPGAPIAVPAAYGIGAITGDLWFNFKVGGGQEYARLRDLKDEQGQPLPENVVKVASLVSGAAQAGISLVPIFALIKSIPGGQDFIARMTGQVTPKIIAKLGYGPAILRAVGDWAKHTVQGAVGMAGITAASIAGEVGAKSVSGQPFEQPTLGEAAGVVGQSFLDALPVMGIMGAPGLGAKVGLDLANTRRSLLQAETAKQHYLELGQAVEGSKLADRLPDAHSEVIEQITKDTGAEHIYIPVDAFEQYAQSKKADPVAMAEELGIGALYQQARDEAGDIKVPTAVWAAKTRLVAKETGVPVWADLADDVKFSAEGETPRQARARGERLQNDLVQASDEAIKADKTGALESQRQIIADQRYEQLRDAGRPEKEARDGADLYSRMVVRLSAQTENLTPEQANVALVRKIKGVDELKAPVQMTPEQELAAQRRQLYSETKAEIDQMPERQAAADLRKRLGPGFRRLAIREMEKNDITPEQRQAFHDVAGTFGLGEGEDLIKLIAEQPKLEDVVNQALNERLAGTFGDPRQFQLANPKAAQPLMDIYATISDQILELRTKHTDERLAKPLHDSIGKLLKDFGQAYKLSKESAEFADWLRKNADNVDREVLYQKVQETFGKGSVPLDSRGMRGYTIREGSADNGYQTDLFGVPEKSGASSAEAGGPGRKGPGVPAEPPGKYAVRTELVQDNVREIGVARVTSRNTAAQALAHLSNRAVEHFDALVTDKDGKPLAIIGSFKGNTSQSHVYISTLVSEAIQIDGASQIWIAHNHPSGNPELSAADHQVREYLMNAFRGSSIEAKGVFAISSGKDGTIKWEFTDGGTVEIGIEEPGKGSVKLPVLERVITQADNLGPVVNGPEEAARAVKSIAGEESGVLFLNSKHYPVGFAPVDAEAVSKLRAGGQMDPIYRGLSISNADAVIISKGKGMSDQGALNLAGLFNNIGTRVLDVVDFDSDSPDSWRSAGRKIDSPIFMQAAAGAFDPRSRDLLLSFKNANASTFVHESAHAWLSLVDELVKAGRASDSLISDHTTLMQFLGAEYDKPLTSAQQEKFAAAFEAYLREGKAPTPELKGAFRRFRAWLVKIYRSVKDIGGGILGDEGISPEVRAVMDRMLASEDEISQAEKQAEYNRQMSLENVAPEVIAKLDDLRAQAHDEAVEELLKVQMEEISSARQKEKADKRAELIQRGTELFQGDREYVSAKYLGKDYRDIASRYLENKLSEDDRATFEVLAESEKYYSPEEMADKLVKLKPLDEAAVSWADRIMHDLYPEYRETELIKEKALELVHSSTRQEILELEGEILAEKLARQSKSADAQRAGLARARVEAREARAKAEEILAKKRVADLRSPVPYFTAEREAAAKAAEALAKKDLVRAAEWKRKQILNHALAVATMRLKVHVDNTLKQINGLLGKREPLLKDQETADQVGYLLERFGFGRRVGYDPEKRTESLAAYIRRMDIFFKSDPQDSSPYQVADWIQSSDAPRPYKTLRIDELQDVNDALKNIMHVANMQESFYTLSEKLSIKGMADYLAAQADENLGAGRLEKQVETKLDQIKRTLAKGGYSHLQVLTVLQWLDGNKRDGAWQKSILRPVTDLAEKESRAIDVTSKRVAEIMKGYSKKERNEIFTKRILVPEFGVNRENPITKETLMSLLLNMGNAGNLDRLVSKAPEGFYPTFEWSRANAEQVVTSIRDVLARHLDRRDLEAVQAIWDLLETYWPEISAHQYRMSGFKPKQVQAVPFEMTLRDGTAVKMRGGYYPLRRDPRTGPRSQELVEAETELARQESVARIPATRHGFTEFRTGGTYSVYLGLDALPRHLGDVLHDLNFREVVVDLRRLLGNQGFFDGVKRNLGIQAYSYLKEWVYSLASGGNSDLMPPSGQGTTFYNSFLHWVNTNAVSSAVMLAPRIINQNLSNVFLYGNAIQGWSHADAMKAAFQYGIFDYLPKNLVKIGTVGLNKSALEMRQFIWGKSQFMKDRAKNPEPTLRAYKKVLLNQKKDLSTFGTMLLSWSDDLWNTPQWTGAYHKKLAETGSEKEAVHFADSLIKSAIMVESKYELAPVLRSNNETIRLFTRLYGFWNSQLNRFLREEGPKLKNPIKNAPALLGFVAAQTMFIYSSALLSGMGPKPDSSDEEKAKWFASQVIRNYLSYLPIARDIVPVVFDRVLGTGFAGASYRPSVGFGAVERATDNLIKIGKQIGSGFEGGAQATLEPLSDIAAFVSPYPRIFNALFWNAIDMMEGMEFRPGDLIGRRPRAER